MRSSKGERDKVERERKEKSGKEEKKKKLKRGGRGSNMTRVKTQRNG